jgi:hypothetical protein
MTAENLDIDHEAIEGKEHLKTAFKILGQAIRNIQTAMWHIEQELIEAE